MTAFTVVTVIPNSVSINTWLAFLTPLVSVVLIVLQGIKNNKLKSVVKDLTKDNEKLASDYENISVEASHSKQEAQTLKTQIGQIQQTNQPMNQPLPSQPMSQSKKKKQ